MIVESSIAMPDEGVVDWFSVFSIDHNYYNIENSWLRGSWGDRGVEKSTMFVAKMKVKSSGDISKFSL